MTNPHPNSSRVVSCGPTQVDAKRPAPRLPLTAAGRTSHALFGDEYFDEQRRLVAILETHRNIT